MKGLIRYLWPFAIPVFVVGLVIVISPLADDDRALDFWFLRGCDATFLVGVFGMWRAFFRKKTEVSDAAEFLNGSLGMIYFVLGTAVSPIGQMCWGLVYVLVSLFAVVVL